MKLVKSQEVLADMVFVSDLLQCVVEQELKTLLKLPNYCPDNDGYVVVIESSDTGEEHRKLFGCLLDEILWEGVRLEAGVWIGVMLTNNQFGFTVIISDEAWLPVKLRTQLATEAGFRE